MIWRACRKLSGLVPTNSDQAAVETTCLGRPAIARCRLSKLADIDAEEVRSVRRGITKDHAALHVPLELAYRLVAESVEDDVPGTQEADPAAVNTGNHG